MMEKQNKKLKLIVLATLILFIGIALFYNFFKNHNQYPKKTSIGVYRGNIIKLDLSAMKKDGDGVLEISSASKVKPFHISSGESSCDTQAIKVPKGLAVGKDVEIVALNKGRHLSICEKGTYIKVL